MDKFEYGSVRLGRDQSDAVITITTDDVRTVVIKDVAPYLVTEEITFPSGETRPTKWRYCLKKSPLFYIQPILAELGKEGWEVIEYKSDEFRCFGEALLKRKVQ